MTVHELIEKLERLDRFSEIVICLDQSEEGFKVSPIDSIDEADTLTNEKIYVISPLMIENFNN